MKRLPDWYYSVAGLVLALWLGFNLYYRFGAEGVEVSGASVSFDRQYDRQLLRVNDQLAFIISSGYPSVVRYERGAFPFCPLCGIYEPAGTVVNGTRYRKGDWVYSDSVSGYGSDMVNLRTGEAIDVPEGEVRDPREFDPATVEAYRARGLRFDPASALSPEQIAREFEAISTINESCVVFNAAFLLLLAVLLLSGIVLFLRGPRAA
jgi:hypothetical protein